MNSVDQDALERAIVACRAQDAGRRRQVDLMLADQPWEEVATFCAFSAQIEALGLLPWQSPPIYACLGDLDQPYDDTRAARESAELLRRLLDNGLSKFEPDPITAIARAEAERRVVRLSD